MNTLRWLSFLAFCDVVSACYEFKEHPGPEHILLHHESDGYTADGDPTPDPPDAYDGAADAYDGHDHQSAEASPQDVASADASTDAGSDTGSDAMQVHDAGTDSSASDAGPGGCQSNNDCPTGYFCDAPGSGCSVPGNCVPRPTTATCGYPMPVVRVCGCDNITYNNDCYSAAAGIRVRSEGPC